MTDKQIIIDCVDVSGWTDGEVYYKLQHYSPKATKQIAFDLYKQLKRKEQECEKLRAENKHLNDLLNQALKDYEKAIQTLTEIKEIAEHCINKDICTFCDYSDRCYIEDEEIPTYDVCKLILQKISECEVENE